MCLTVSYNIVKEDVVGNNTTLKVEIIIYIFFLKSNTVKFPLHTGNYLLGLDAVQEAVASIQEQPTPNKTSHCYVECDVPFEENNMWLMW